MPDVRRDWKGSAKGNDVGMKQTGPPGIKAGRLPVVSGWRLQVALRQKLVDHGLYESLLLGCQRLITDLGELLQLTIDDLSGHPS